MLLTQDATPLLKNVMSAKKVMRDVTPLLSALLPVENHMPSATQELESALHVTQPRTKTALKLKPLATKNAKSNHFQNVTSILESVSHAKKVLDVSQLPVASQPAHTSHTQTTSHTCATGLNPHQNASKTRADQ